MKNTEIPTDTEVRTLAGIREPGCLTIYLPSSPVRNDSDIVRIELKDRFRDAVNQLEAAQADGGILDALTRSVTGLLDDDEFWRRQSRSLALFVTQTLLVTYRLPTTVTASTEVSDRLHLAPLMSALTFPRSAFVLALSQNSVRLVAVTGELSATVVVPGLPTDLKSEIGLDLTGDRSTLGRRASEDPKVRMREYSQAIDRALRPVIAGSGRPLIIAAAEPLASIYRAVSTYENLVADIIAGNPDERSNDDLADAARRPLDTIYAAELSALTTEFDERAAGALTVTDLHDVARCATGKAIGLLFVDIDAHIPGRIDELSGVVSVSDRGDASNYCVVDEILSRALVSDAQIVAVRASEVPGGGPVAAILRFVL